ncbi:MAG: SLC13 family permease [Saprospirales bacterium]|nr:SLC13 family permease [Saprospirales bacterium]MBK8490518.1 SLC13 family permease [Saprospirales bacterium]
MEPQALLVLVVLLAALVLFITEWLSIDLIALALIPTLVLAGVLTPEEGVAGFGNSATLTVAFLFALSGAFFKTGALQQWRPYLTKAFKKNFLGSFLLMMLVGGTLSAFINNTPVVAVFIPMTIQIARSIGKNPSQLLLPLCFATTAGGTCTLIGTSTNLLVSGIAVELGLPAFSMFQLFPVGIVLLTVAIVYLLFIGRRLLPNRPEETIDNRVVLRDYLVEIELLANSPLVGQKIMDSALLRDLELDIIAIYREGDRFIVPPGDMVLQRGDILKVRGNVEAIKQLKDQWVVHPGKAVRIGDGGLQDPAGSSMIELVVTANSELQGQTLRQLDFRRKFRAIPLAIRHREEIIHEHLHDTPLQAGDVILAEVKSHYIQTLRKWETERDSPFILLSEEGLPFLNKRKLILVSVIALGIILSASLGWIPILIGSIAGVTLLVITRCLTMREVYESIDWKVVFLLAGSLSMGIAMQKSGLAQTLANELAQFLGPHGPVFLLSGIYLLTMLLTETMSNAATAALVTPIAIAMAQQLGLSPTPFLMAVTFAASSSFMTPIGYQTNAMIYSAGNYRFTDFIRVGAPLSLLFWILATFLIPYFFPF